MLSSCLFVFQKYHVSPSSPQNQEESVSIPNANECKMKNDGIPCVKIYDSCNFATPTEGGKITHNKMGVNKNKMCSTSRWSSLLSLQNEQISRKSNNVNESDKNSVPNVALTSPLICRSTSMHSRLGVLIAVLCLTSFSYAEDQIPPLPPAGVRALVLPMN